MNAKVGLKTVFMFLLEKCMMATNVRGRSGSRSTRDNYGFGSWGSTGTSEGTSAGTRGKGSPASASPKYRNVCSDFACKISSYKTLYNQTHGAAKYTRPTPQTLNTFASWINKGAIIQTCSATQVAKWARTGNWTFNTRQPTTTSCKDVLSKKFGKTTIKAVARTKTGSFMVVTSPTWKGKSFQFPK